MKSMAHPRTGHRVMLAYIVTLIVMVILGALNLYCIGQPTPHALTIAFFGSFIPAIGAGLIVYKRGG